MPAVRATSRRESATVRAVSSVRRPKTTAGRYGGLDIAFNNAGGAFPGLLADLDEDAWQQSLAVNLTGVWLSMKHEVTYMREHGGGVIVNMASTIGDGIRINAISPGPIDTPASQRPGETTAQRDERIAASLPIGRVGSLDEIAAAITWLASPESGFAVGPRTRRWIDRLNVPGAGATASGRGMVPTPSVTRFRQRRRSVIGFCRQC